MPRLISPVAAVERGLPSNILDQSETISCYPSSNSIILSASPNNVCIIQHHQAKVTSVAISPSGAWIASGDAKGQLKIWTSRGENLLKYEYKLFAGSVRSLAWSPDSKRIAVCGGDPSKGGEAVCISFDTGSRLGELSGHSKSVASVAYRPCAPFRIMTGSEDTAVIFHEGPPFKFMRSHQTVHTAFVNAVAFSQDGSKAFSCASDGIVAVYAGDTGDLISKLTPKLPCSIWGLCVLGNSTSVLALACGDKKVRIFDGQSIVCEQQVGSGDLQDMPMGISGTRNPPTKRFTTISLDGTFRHYCYSENNLDLESTVQGSSGSITSISPYCENDGFVVCTSNGSVWSVESPNSAVVSHDVRKTPVKVSAGTAKLATKTICCVNNTGNSVMVLGSPNETLTMEGVSRLVFAKSSIFSLCNKSQSICRIATENDKLRLVSKHDSLNSITVLAASDSGDCVVFSTEKKSSSNLVSGTLREFNLIKMIDNQFSSPIIIETEMNSSDIVALAVTNGGETVAVASAGQELHVYRSGKLVQGTRNCWTYHKARITAMQWLDDRFLVTGGLDKNVYVWDLEDPAEGPVGTLKDVHRDGVSCLYAKKVSPSDIRIVSGGVEGSVCVNVLVLKRI